MRATAVFSLLITIAATSHLACGESDEERQRREALEKEQSEQEAFANEYCLIVNECCNQILAVPKDVEACKQRMLAADPVTYKNAEARVACITQLKANYQRFDFCSDFGNMEIPACPDPHRKELTGTKKIGESCSAASECAPSFDGVVRCKGVCQLVKRGKEGSSSCITTMDGDIERPVNDLSDPEVVVCYTRDGIVCDPESKKCITQRPAEQPCTDTRQCQPGLFCEEREKKCFPRIDTGKSCTQIDECKGYCQGATEEEFGECVEAVAEGASCSDTQPCEAGFACTAGKCSPPPPDARLAGACTAP